MLMRPFAIRLPENEKGRDFVVGDLHGCFDELLCLMQMVRFNPAVDRIFAVGDLTHRGFKNIECLQLLHQEWFFSVLGNHDTPEAIIDAPDFEIRQPFIQDLANLPLMYQVGYGDNAFFVIHAELPFELLFADSQLPPHFLGKEEFMASGQYANEIKKALIQIIDDYENFSYFIPRNKEKIHDVFFDMIWSRDVWKMGQKQYAPFQYSPLRIFCGHSPVEKVMKIGHQIFCDTGAAWAYQKESAFKNGALSLIDTKNNMVYSVLAKSLQKQSPYPIFI